MVVQLQYYIEYIYFQHGKLVYPKSNRDGCLPFKLEDFNGDELAEQASVKDIIMVDRGLCSFVAKVRNIEAFGVHLAVIADTVNEFTEAIVMGDDGTGHDIKIPAYIIKSTDAEKIKAQLENAKIEDSYVFIKSDIEIAHPDNIVEYELFYSSIIDLDNRLLEDLARYQAAFGDNVVFTPRIRSYSCIPCSSITRQQDCLSDGGYCPLRSNNLVELTLDDIPRRLIMEESLREKCLLTSLIKNSDLSRGTQRWFEYMLAFQSSCLSNQNFNAECSYEQMQQIGLRDIQEIVNCYNSSFIINKTLTYNEFEHNAILDEDYERAEMFSVKINPSIVINNMTYRGDFEAYDIFMAICSGFSSRPNICKLENMSKIEKSRFRRNGNHQRSHHINFIHVGVAIFIVVSINLGALCAYRYFNKKKLKTQLNQHVNSAVSQYFKISQNESQNDIQE
ncbi:UNKNOWN [Stylonychia lemnae]|uniref:Uncharacterized protein n=1 Tax=Stylonychia lemnae TaxID=5949 RepID=A0A078B496_STYLE|nr:UNKNOWN [Stylonychia lemnae]|eukprot:CDW89350.1 UNKNOWN [Stylonychia lemnae]